MPRFCGGMLIALVPLTALAEQPLPVQVVTAQPGRMQHQAEFVGTIQARDSVDFGFRQGGRVSRALVDAGDRVQIGDILAEIDPLQQDQALVAAQAALASALATLEQARQSRDRAEAMLARRVGTQAERDAAEQAFSAAAGQVQQAEAIVDQAQRAVSDTVLRAPATGVITNRQVEPGQIVSPGQPVLSMASSTGLEVEFLSPDSAWLAQTLGTPVTLTPIDMHTPDMHGVITEIAPLVAPLTGSVRLAADLEDMPDPARLLGAAVRVHLTLDGAESVAVPWTALTSTGNQPAVWLVGPDNRVMLQSVDVLGFSTETVQIGQGLQAGQQVVAAGSQMLYPGRLIVPAVQVAP